MSIVIAAGPPTSRVSEEEAITRLERQPDFPKGAEVAMTEVEGRWIAAIHTADFPLGDSDEESPSPKSEGPDDTAPAPADDKGGDSGSSDGPPSDGDDGEGPPKEHGEGKGGEKHEIQAVLDLVSQIAMALGIPDPSASSPVPGEEGPPAGPPGPAGPPMGGPPAPGPKPGAEQSIRHDRALKPGEAPVGTTPIGAPAFASVDSTPHPWAAVVAGGKASFTLEERIPEDLPLAQVDKELSYLASTASQINGKPLKVKRIDAVENEQGHRIARASISIY